MDPSFNDFEEEIRLPDEVKRERLMPDTRTDFDIEMDEALYLSMQELRQQNIKNDKFEEEIMNSYHSETNERREKFSDLLKNMTKLSKFDKDIKEDLIEQLSLVGEWISEINFDKDIASHTEYYNKQIKCQTIYLILTIMKI
jgi:small-conductance mechanosensitive channel